MSNYDLQEDQKVVEITVRDRRQVHQFSIHNLVVDEWLPIITIWGLGLYTFFVRLANRRDERSFPGYRLIQRHLKMSPTTISHYNKLLVWCGLVHIEPGDRVNSNDYYILDIPKVTPEKLAEIRQQAIEHFPPGNKFLKALLKRLDKWQPVQALWDAGSDKRTVVVHKAQLALPLDEGVDGATPDKQGTTPDKQGATPNKEGATPNKEGAPPGVAEQSETTIRNNNPKQQSEQQQHDDDVGLSESGRVALLVELAQAERKPLDLDLAHALVEPYTLEQVTGLVEYTRQSTSLRDPLAFAISRLRSGELPVVAIPFDYAHGKPEPEKLVNQADCRGCGASCYVWDLCRECGQCEDCCQCEAEIVDPALAEAQRVWEAALGELQLQMTRGTFNMWLKPTRVLGRENGVFSIEVDNGHVKDWLENRLLGTVLRTLRGIVKEDVEIRFVVQER